MQPSTAIETPDLRLHSYLVDDVDDVFEAVAESIDDLTPYETWCRPGFTRADAERYVTGWIEAWMTGEAHYFAIRSAEDDRYLGSVGLAGISTHHGVAGLGFWVRTSATRQGVATRAAQAIIAWAHDELGLRRIELMSAEDNLASQSVAAKVGAVFEGILRRRLVLPAGPTDMALSAVVFD